MPTAPIAKSPAPRPAAGPSSIDAVVGHFAELPGHYVRRAVELSTEGLSKPLVTMGLSAGDRVVVEGAQTLLSHEQLHGGGGAEEE